MTLPIRNEIPGDCGQILLQASALSDGEASPQAALEIRRHLLDCSDCRDRTDEMTRLVAVLESLPVFDPPPELEDRLLAAVRGKIDAAPRQRRPRRRIRHLSLVGSLAAGGLLLCPLKKLFDLTPGFPGSVPSGWEIPPLILDKFLAIVGVLIRETVEGIRHLVLGIPSAPSLTHGPEGFMAAWPYLLLVAAVSLGLLLMTTPWLTKDLIATFRLQDRRRG